MNHEFSPHFFTLLIISFFITGCNDDDDSSPQATPDPGLAAEISLDDVSDGMGQFISSGDTTLLWNGMANYRLDSQVTVDGTSYFVWEVNLSNGSDTMTLKILQEDEAGTGPVMPEDGTYGIVGGLGENDLVVYTDSKVFTFRPSSSGSFSIEKSNEGELWNIEISAMALEDGGIDEERSSIDMAAVLKAEVL